MNKELHKRIRLILNNDILKGFKNTKIGIIPEDWEVLRLKDKFDRLSRKNAEGNTNVLTISAQYGLINQEEFFKKEIASDDKSNYYLLHRGEFAYNKSYSNGYPFGVIKRLSRYDKGVVSPLYICFSANNNNACPEYYEQYFEAGRLNHEIQAYAQEGARNHGLLNISVIDFFNSFILVPPIAEQKRIAKILSAQDKVIECYEKKIEQLKRMKKYYLQNMFPKHGETVPKIRFKGFTDSWKQRKLGECVEFLDTMRKPLKESEREKGIYPYYGASGIVDYISNYIFDEELVLLSEDGANITDRNYPVCFLASGKYWVNNHAHVLRVYTENENNFICNSLERMDFTKYNSGMAMPKLNKDVCHNIPLFCPIHEEQKQIGDYFRTFDNLITLHQRKLEEEKKKKKALQQLLLTGIVRTN